MTAVTRSLGTGVETATQLQHTALFHICDLVLPTSGTQYLSEGAQLAFDNGEGGGSHNYLAGRIRVGRLQWDADGAQGCTLEVLDNAAHDAYSWFLLNKIADATVRIWLVYRNSADATLTPIKYAVGSCDASELTAEGLRITVITSNAARKFFPNTYVGSVLPVPSYLPQEGAVVFWNSTAYVLERAYE